MNFFEHQDQARRNTAKLVMLMVLAVVTLIAVTTALAAAFVYYFQFDGTQQMRAYEQGRDAFSFAGDVLTWELLGTVSFVVGSIVALSSVYKILQLSGGGRKVAEAMNGRLLQSSTRDADEKKILNVVEEMAIASGTPVPPVYLIEDDSINAFAAGFKAQDAVIGITRGSIRTLSRDELQGVIAHEFSHIMHGDMRLNIRLVGILHGILVIGLIGYFIMRGAGSGARVRSGNRGNNAAALFFAGLALTIVGYAGTFFGNLIKAAVSRQREFLADASAVQFTRNPDGIAGALKKIGGHAQGSVLQSSHAAEFSHMFFGQGIRTRFNAWFATHPPLSERIKRIDPQWQGDMTTTAASQTFNGETTSGFAETTMPNGAEATTGKFEQVAAGLAVSQTLADVGMPRPAHVAEAQRIIGQIPNALKAASEDAFSASALMFSLLLDKHDEAIRQKQWHDLGQNAQPAMFKLTQDFAQAVTSLERELHLPLVELSLPALKQLSPPQYTVFKRNLVALIRADQRLELFEWALYRMLVHNLENTGRGRANARLNQLHAESELLLSVLARAGNPDPDQMQAALNAALTELHINSKTTVQSTIPFNELDQALTRLNHLKPLEKPRLLKAMATCVSHDGLIKPEEMEVFRAIADSLDCPIPPGLKR